MGAGRFLVGYLGVVARFPHTDTLLGFLRLLRAAGVVYTLRAEPPSA